MDNFLIALKTMLQRAAEIKTSHDLVRFLVGDVKNVMTASVCSLYLRNRSGLLVLASTEGLSREAEGVVVLKVGEGLVGTVAQSLHPLNLAKASAHPAYRHFEGITEENFQSFLGVPLVRLGATVGVLVVQKEQAVRFTDVEEAFLVTIGAHIAGVVGRLDWFEESAQTDQARTANRRFSGVKGSPGVGIGSLNWVDLDLLSQVQDKTCEDIGAEILRYQDALARSRQSISHSLHSLKLRELPGDLTGLLNVYSMLIDSPELNAGVLGGIREGNWAEGALRRTILNFVSVFSNMDDPYLKARAEDIVHLGNKIYGELLELNMQHAEPDSPVILIGELVGVTDIARVPLHLLAGVVCVKGSALSHTSVLARALGIPAIMGIGEVRDLSGGLQAIVDGHAGCLIIEPTREVLNEYHKVLQREDEFARELATLAHQPPITRDGETIELLANTGLLVDITPGLRSGASGIGLYRSEIPFLAHSTFPTEEEQFEIYRHVLQAYRGKPVCMRTLDIGGDKALPYFDVEEENPSLGWRGIRFSLDNLPILVTQLRAMLKAASDTANLSIMIPMVSHVEEVLKFKNVLNEVVQQLESEGHVVHYPLVGIMIEVPSSITLLKFIRPHIDFVSVGTNDLTQYVLAADRGNSQVSSIVDSLQPAVLHELVRLTEAAKNLSLSVSICGEMASDPLAVPLLIGMGIRKLSMGVRNLPMIKWEIRSVSARRCQELVTDVLTVATVKEVREKVSAMLLEFELGRLLE